MSIELINEMRGLRIGIEDAIEAHRAESNRLARMLADMELMCPHEWKEGARVGPYAVRECKTCGAKDYVTL
jgi:hypothetical protein